MKCRQVRGKVRVLFNGKKTMPRWLLAVLSAIFLTSAGPLLGDEIAPNSSELETIAEDYFEEFITLNPLNATFIGDMRYNDRLANNLGPEYRAASDALDRNYLEQLLALDSAQLDRQDCITYETFKLDLENNLEMRQFPGHLLALNQFYSFANSFAQLGSGASAHPFKSEKDYSDFLSRIDGFLVLVDQAIANMREGVERGVTQPKVLMERTLDQLAAQDTDFSSSVFFGPIANLPEDIPGATRDSLTSAFEQAHADKLRPAYKKLHDFIKGEYLPVARTSVGLSALGQGEQWYAALIRQTTTTNLSARDIHDIGLREVASIQAEMHEVMDQVGFQGDLDAFFGYLKTHPDFFYDEPHELIEGYRAMSDHIQSLAPKLFAQFPKSEFEVRAVEAFREKSAADGSYMSGTPDGSRPGIFYANTYDVGSRPKWEMESLFLHEAIPGHHFQISLQRELEGLPRIRRFGGYTAFVEGWGLYAESLGKELGVYTDPYQYFGALNAELWRAIRLVVDTGLHTKGWTREDVLAYMFENSASGEASAVSEAERYIAIPSQALAYKIGELKIRELRTRAEAELGEDFDVREFHTQVLMDGALPLSLLESKIESWIASE